MGVLMRRYLACGMPTTGTTGFTNFVGASEESKIATIDRIFAENPDAYVVIDGDDDWCALMDRRPPVFCEHHLIDIIALYHTRNSGITSSGVVLNEQQFKRFWERLDEGSAAYLRFDFRDKEVNCV
jgi:hypothetical protein